ncbi:MAG TPA: DUF3147 family protein, partial [Polyangiaceae bacterium]
MKPTVDLGKLTKSRPWEYGVRFLFGGLVTACAGLVTHRWGPVVGGLLLGFPAILPASLTLVEEHGGRAEAVDDARGGTLGSVGLVAFGAVVWLTADGWPAAGALLVATVAWAVVAGGLWALR